MSTNPRPGWEGGINLHDIADDEMLELARNFLEKHKDGVQSEAVCIFKELCINLIETDGEYHSSFSITRPDPDLRGMYASLTGRGNVYLEALNKIHAPESYVIGEIIKIDFHEFVHHFLSTNTIRNNCCTNHKNNSVGECWLCKFTHGLKVMVTVEPIKPYGEA